MRGDVGDGRVAIGQIEAERAAGAARRGGVAVVAKEQNADGHFASFTNYEAALAELERIVPRGAAVVFHNGVTDAEYDGLLRRATALVSLSRAEGYGLPLVEAMAVGTPVIASDIPIFREVGSDAAIYVDPESPGQFADAVGQLQDDAHWQDLSRRSMARASEFSWDESARQLVDAAHEVVAKRRRA